MNYIESSVRYDPVRVGEFLDWMTENNVAEINEITGRKVKKYFNELSKRKSKKTGELLTPWALRAYLMIINRFARYIRHIGEGNIEVPVSFAGKIDQEIIVLRQSEIERIYQVIDDSFLGLRDRAMLGVLYGCGLRRNEAEHLELSDLILDRNLLYVRKGKGYKERHVPMVKKVKTDLVNYVQLARPIFLTNQIHQALFISTVGKPLGGLSIYNRIKRLYKLAEINEKAATHTLRHSIATHLLMSGMKLTQIARFLGHSSLESTQIYTHLTAESVAKEVER